MLSLPAHPRPMGDWGRQTRAPTSWCESHSRPSNRPAPVEVSHAWMCQHRLQHSLNRLNCSTISSSDRHCSTSYIDTDIQQLLQQVRQTTVEQLYRHSYWISGPNKHTHFTHGYRASAPSRSHRHRRRPTAVP